MYKLVLIDDEAYILEQLFSLLNWKELGFEIVASLEYSNEIFDFLESNKVDVILSDISMPYPNGLDIAEYCSVNFPEIQFVLISGYREFEYARQAIKYNVFEYITKPISYDDFYNCIRALSISLSNKVTSLEDTISENNLVSKVMEYIEQNYKKAITLDDVCRYTAMSKGYFCSQYKKLKNESLITTLNKYRIARAKELLSDPHIKPSTVGQFVGYQNTQHFYRIFKSATGTTPHMYQIRMKNNE